MNATVNAFMENMKCTLSKDKCNMLHVGKIQGKCFTQKFHNEIMHQVDSTKYLGDIIHKNGNLASNMSNRLAKGLASLSII